MYDVDHSFDEEIDMDCQTEADDDDYDFDDFDDFDDFNADSHVDAMDALATADAIAVDDDYEDDNE